jgi:hypothetical protein
MKVSTHGGKEKTSNPILRGNVNIWPVVRYATLLLKIIANANLGLFAGSEGDQSYLSGHPL